MKNRKFLGKAFIRGRIQLMTGLHIGGSKTSLDIGGLDLSVIKTADKEVPFIPGSSLKGKLRSLIAREVGSTTVENDSENHHELFEIFGYPAENNPKKASSNGSDSMARLLVRDAFLDTRPFEDKIFQNLDFEYTEEKWENTIERTTGKALHPRQLERVPAGAEFSFILVYTVYDDKVSLNQSAEQYKCNWHIGQIRKAMRYLEDDYLGGHGSRGYGQIVFREVQLRLRTVSHYETNTEPEGVLLEGFWTNNTFPPVAENMNHD